MPMAPLSRGGRDAHIQAENVKINNISPMAIKKRAESYATFGGVRNYF